MIRTATPHRPQTAPVDDLDRFFDLARGRCGTTHAYVFDLVWAKDRKCERIDLFHRYAQDAGEVLNTRELLLAGGPDGAVPIYAIPAPKMAAFVEWLDRALFPFSDGSFVAAKCFRPGANIAAGRTARSMAGKCHMIYPVHLPADHPSALLARMRNRASLTRSPLW
jgi:hypothetical protein